MRGETIQSTWVAVAAHEGATELMERVGAELHHLLGQRPRLPTVVVQDGAPELWNLVDEWLGNSEGHVAYFENHALKIRYATARKRGARSAAG